MAQQLRAVRLDICSSFLRRRLCKSQRETCDRRFWGASPRQSLALTQEVLNCLKINRQAKLQRQANSPYSKSEAADRISQFLECLACILGIPEANPEGDIFGMFGLA